MRLLLRLFGVVLVIAHVAPIDIVTSTENVTLSGITKDVESKSSELTTPTSDQTVSTIIAADSPTESTTTEDSFLNISTSALSNVTAEIKSNVPTDKPLSASSETTTSEPKLLTLNTTSKIEKNTILNDENVTVSPINTILLQSVNQSNELTTIQQKLTTVIPALSSFNPETNLVQSDLITNTSDSSSLPSTTILSNEPITETTKQTTTMPEHSKTISGQTEQISIKPESATKITDLTNEQTSTDRINETTILVEPNIKSTVQSTNDQQVTTSQPSAEDIISTTLQPVLRDTEIIIENPSSESSKLQLTPSSIQVESNSITNEFERTTTTEAETTSVTNTELTGIHPTYTPPETIITSTYTEPELSTLNPELDKTPTETTISPIQSTSIAQEITPVQLHVTTEVITSNSEITTMPQNPTTTGSSLVLEDNTNQVTTYSPSTENLENHTQSKEPITTKPVTSIGNLTPSEVITGNFTDVVNDNNTTGDTNGLTVTNFTDSGGNHHISISTNVKDPSFNVADFLSHLASFFKPNNANSVGVTGSSEAEDSGSESDSDDHSSMSTSSESSHSSEESTEQGNGSSQELEGNGANLWNLLSGVFGPSGDESSDSGDSTAGSDHHTSQQGESKESAESQEAAVADIYAFWDQLLGELRQKLSK
ncbi:hypothetical protein K1T71_013196 [Dendrolimus kikuchii]|uniref:Uncharacterized protein n=1 Tax=Dendrolimus kikuchii TaxID=765133 RepID=A0ACC1CHP6_9NEOP|nr:hypothetical protein K1T71_013196 [Dendrolimus kikuchii]